jgi:hypothetical protein
VTSDAGWFADPTGRFAKRWYDGAAWTDNVVGASGAVVADPLPASQHPYAPPTPEPRTAPVGPAAHWTPPPQASAPGWPGPAATGAVRYGPGLGLLIGLVGLVAALLSLFVLEWADVDQGTFLDLGKAARKVGSDDYPYATAYIYVAWAGFVLFALAVLLVVVAGLPLPRSAAGNTYARVIGAVVAGGAAVLQTVVIV